MADDSTYTYGWDNDMAPGSCDYVAPAVLDILKDLGVSRVVDLGAGNGALCAMMKTQGLDAVGLEYDREGCAVARRANPGIPFYNLSVEEDPAHLLATEAPFDAVVSTEVIEHLYAPHFLPIFAAQVLKPGGHIVISTPYHGYLKNLALSVFDKWDFHHTPLWHGGHIKFWSRKTLTQLLETNGFQVTNFTGVGRVPFLWKSMILIARKV